MNANTINQNAIDALDKSGTYDENDYYSAQQLFKQNAKSAPSLMTFNNLGVFYTEYGMELANGKIISAKKQGLKYLKKASSFSNSYINLMAIGDWHFSEKDYLNAECYYRLAYNMHASSDVLANLGSTLFIQQKYNEAGAIFEQALRICEVDRKDEINLEYAFSLVYNNKRSKTVKSILESLEDKENPDVLVLAYLNEDMQLVDELIERVVDNYHIDIPIVAMVIDCLLKLEKQIKAKEFLNEQIENLKGFDYNIKSEINRLSKLTENTNARNIEITNYRYLPGIYKICYFIGCWEHNPL